MWGSGGLSSEMMPATVWDDFDNGGASAGLSGLGMTILRRKGRRTGCQGTDT